MKIDPWFKADMVGMAKLQRKLSPEISSVVLWRKLVNILFPQRPASALRQDVSLVGDHRFA